MEDENTGKTKRNKSNDENWIQFYPNIIFFILELTVKLYL